MDDVLQRAIADRVTPGVCYAIGLPSGTHLRAWGHLSYGSDSAITTQDTIWDLASLTKVVATTTAVMLLESSGAISLDDRVSNWLPDFSREGKSEVTLRNLLLHDSGLPASHPCPTTKSNRDALIEDLWNQEPVYETGAGVVYSDLGFIALGFVVESVTGEALDDFFQARVASPLGLSDTGYAQTLARRRRTAPTELVEDWRRRLRKERHLESAEILALETDAQGNRWTTGEVHDPTAMVLGGVAGHAGLFSTIHDLATFMRALAEGRIVPKDVLRAYTTAPDRASSRALGWDTPSDGSSAGTKLGPRSYGHTGFTGTSIWVDPDLDLFAILLSNRVHPTADNLGIRKLRRDFHDAIVESIRL